MSAPLPPAARDVLLGLADDEICLGHWYATWMGLGPFLEEDLATTSIGQDELGHARALYALVEPGGDVDALAYGRAASGYRSSWLAELAIERWEDLFARHLLYDEAEAVRWEALVGSSVPGLGAVAERALHEEVYHTRHARSLFSRLMAGGPEGRARVSAALERVLPLAVGLFEPTEGDEAAVAEGAVAAPAAEQGAEWRRRVERLLAEVGHSVAWPELSSGPHGRRGVRSPAFAPMFAEMTRVYALDPSARW
ncbi:MAG: phenylacetate-CoA oxygenase subunit PaaC [Acidimicrobiia bacterium]|nr:phenylacetate-CoA oxygenase subunit PaaC [Acidimicrobiia bacterium]